MKSSILFVSGFILVSFASVQGTTIAFNALNGVFRASDGNPLPDGSPVRVGVFDPSFNYNDIFAFSSMPDLVNSSSFTAYEDLQAGSMQTVASGGFVSFSVQNVPPLSNTPFQAVAFHDPGSGGPIQWGVFENPTPTTGWFVPSTEAPPLNTTTVDLGGVGGGVGGATLAHVGLLVSNNGFVDGQLAIPEPSTYALLGLGGALLFGFLRRRR